MTKQAIFHDGKLYIDETGYFVDQSECDAIIRMMHERIDGPPKPEMHFYQADVDRWLAAEAGVVETSPRDRTQPIIQGEARDTSSKVWLWLLAGAILAGLLIWWW